MPHAHLLVASLAGALTHTISRHGAFAVFLLMAFDALLPVGGELTMLFAGALAGGAIAGGHPLVLGHELDRGIQAYLVLALIGTIGYLGGALIGWGIGRFGGRALLEGHGRWLHLSEGRLARAEGWFERHGPRAVLLGRLTPIVRSFVSIPAGMLESPIGSYTALTFAGSAIWCFTFAGAGWALGSSYSSLHDAFGYVEALVVGLIAVAIARRRRARANG